MLVVVASALVSGLLNAGATRDRLASANLQAPDLLDAELRCRVEVVTP